MTKEALHEKHGDGHRRNTVILSKPQGKDGATLLRVILMVCHYHLPWMSEHDHVVVCTMVLEHVCGMTSFRYEDDGTKHKQQGELKGLLKRCGFSNKRSVTKL